MRRPRGARVAGTPSTVSVLIAICPSTPLLVPELAGAAGAETAALRDGAVESVRALPRHWIAIGVGSGSYGPGLVGTFAGFGADVRVSLAPGEMAPAPAALPLPVLIAGWIRGAAGGQASVEVDLIDDDTDGLAVGSKLRRRIDEAPTPPGILIVADGANTLTEKAPGGYRPEAAAAQQVLWDAIEGGDAAPMRDLPPAVTGRAAYAVLAGLAGSDQVRARTLYQGAPYGVGYTAATWTLR